MEERYSASLAEAKVRDARESNTPKDAWGHNHYVECMHGHFDGRPHHHHPWH